MRTVKPADIGEILTITGPTESYHPNNIPYLGSDRWSFKPEIALSHSLGSGRKWQVDA